MCDKLCLGSVSWQIADKNCIVRGGRRSLGVTYPLQSIDILLKMVYCNEKYKYLNQFSDGNCEADLCQW